MICPRSEDANERKTGDPAPKPDYSAWRLAPQGRCFDFVIVSKAVSRRSLAKLARSTTDVRPEAFHGERHYTRDLMVVALLVTVAAAVVAFAIAYLVVSLYFKGSSRH
jgi:hypothetical protein